ncbi:uncharacterized protein L3040_002324 [Drepanopeziza brunnea f. sp. 'multigermtubi']|uniref:uncharacterized protein n=1 Tax=Drepanopeziza brunnea f. sp. 'multigermtubi' TaxID=698441 RepID=UPI00238E762F|nr:hypothetical protein L3040_002324 [Drepanopeziza brunnea f. sp. 'multigermtubi']
MLRIKQEKKKKSPAKNAACRSQTLVLTAPACTEAGCDAPSRESEGNDEKEKKSIPPAGDAEMKRGDTFKEIIAAWEQQRAQESREPKSPENPAPSALPELAPPDMPASDFPRFAEAVVAALNSNIDRYKKLVADNKRLKSEVGDLRCLVDRMVKAGQEVADEGDRCVAEKTAECENWKEKYESERWASRKGDLLCEEQRRKILQLEDARHGLETRATTAENLVGSLTEELTELKQQFDAPRIDWATHFADLLMTRDELLEQKSKTEQELRHKTEEVEWLCEQVDEKEDELHAAEYELLEYQVWVDELESQDCDRAESIAKLKDQLSQAEKRCQALTEENAQFRAFSPAAETEKKLAIAKTTIKMLQEMQKEALTRAKTLEEEAKDAKTKIKDLEYQLDLKAPLVEVGAAIRKRFMELSRRDNLGYQGKLNRDIIEKGNAAAHGDHPAADAAVFGAGLWDHRKGKGIFHANYGMKLDDYFTANIDIESMKDKLLELRKMKSGRRSRPQRQWIELLGKALVNIGDKKSRGSYDQDAVYVALMHRFLALAKEIRKIDSEEEDEEKLPYTAKGKTGLTFREQVCIRPEGELWHAQYAVWSIQYTYKEEAVPIDWGYDDDDDDDEDEDDDDEDDEEDEDDEDPAFRRHGITYRDKRKIQGEYM